jgi:uncharacterized membrane protein YcaP (DUF421 family)
MSDVVYFFASWEPVGRILVVGTAMYVSLVVLLRISGSRTLASMNAFDFIVTVAVGSVFGRVLTAKSVSLVEGLVAFALLVGLQFWVAWLRSRWPALTTVFTNPPVLLYFQGEFLSGPMNEERVTKAELRAAARGKKVASMDEIEAIVLESDGSLSVIEADRGEAGPRDAIEPMV